ncbi:Hcp1 family type VI secretion system effector [Chromatiales bacterium (ex Bugula neritina AB1)]|nr:Hcp1 family type VI secretion system effector [Chromatiales bacterium (ex Bugula neritina AB1)]
MAVDIFLKLEGPVINGEAQDDVHAEEIDILAWSWGATQSGTTHMGGGGGAGKVNVNDLSVTKYIDSASHNLLQHCFDGKHIEKGTLVVRKAGGEPLEYYTIIMEDIIISSVSTGGSGGEDRLTENVTLNFSKVDVTYKPQNKDGTAGADKKAGWDIAANKTTV